MTHLGLLVGLVASPGAAAASGVWVEAAGAETLAAERLGAFALAAGAPQDLSSGIRAVFLSEPPGAGCERPPRGWVGGTLQVTVATEPVSPPAAAGIADGSCTGLLIRGLLRLADLGEGVRGTMTQQRFFVDAVRVGAVSMEVTGGRLVMGIDMTVEDSPAGRVTLSGVPELRPVDGEWAMFLAGPEVELSGLVRFLLPPEVVRDAIVDTPLWRLSTDLETVKSKVAGFFERAGGGGTRVAVGPFVAAPVLTLQEHFVIIEGLTPVDVTLPP